FFQSEWFCASKEENLMKSILTGLLAVSLLGGANVPVNDFKALFAKHWQISKEFTLAVAEAMPGEFYNFQTQSGGDEVWRVDEPHRPVQLGSFCQCRRHRTAACARGLRQKDG